MNFLKGIFSIAGNSNFVTAILKYALMLSLTAMLLQVSVFLQPLLPERYQITSVCITVAHLQAMQHNQPIALQSAQQQPKKMLHQQDAKQLTLQFTEQFCAFCTVFSHLTPALDVSFATILIRHQLGLWGFKRTVQHLFFVLLRLFLSPQGRAPPLAI